MSMSTRDKELVSGWPRGAADALANQYYWVHHVCVDVYTAAAHLNDEEGFSQCQEKRPHRLCLCWCMALLCLPGPSRVSRMEVACRNARVT